MKIKKWLLASTFILSAVVMGACGDDVEKASSKAADDVETILVGTGSTMLNINFYDEDGNLTGYDVELLREIDKVIPEYEFEFEVMDFTNLLLGLETKKIDMISHNMAKNAEREEKFLFNEQPYNAIPTLVTVNEKNADIQSIDDLAGKKVGVVPTSNAALFFEKYVKVNNLDAEIVYISDNNDVISQLKNGRIDATFSFPFTVAANNEKADAQQKQVGDALMFTDIHFLFNKGEEELAGKIDEAIQTLIENGTVDKLSNEWFGQDVADNIK